MTEVAARVEESIDGETRWLMLTYGGIELGFIVGDSRDEAERIAAEATRVLRSKRRAVVEGDVVEPIRDALEKG